MIRIPVISLLPLGQRLLTEQLHHLHGFGISGPGNFTKQPGAQTTHAQGIFWKWRHFLRRKEQESLQKMRRKINRLVQEIPRLSKEHFTKWKHSKPHMNQFTSLAGRASALRNIHSPSGYFLCMFYIFCIFYIWCSHTITPQLYCLFYNERFYDSVG